MSTTDTDLQNLVINIGTTAQIEAAIQGGTITSDMLSITTDGPDYAYKDLSNLSTGTKETIVGWGMPDYSAGVSATNPFTPTKNGILICIYSLTSYLGTVKISTGSNDLAAYKNPTSGSGGLISLSAMVCKNQQYTFDTGSLSSAVFYPMKGE